MNACAQIGKEQRDFKVKFKKILIVSQIDLKLANTMKAAIIIQFDKSLSIGSQIYFVRSRDNL
jgi:hypothetical protein